VTPQLRCGVTTVTWSFLLARQRFRQSLLPLIPAANAFGASSIRATSAPSAVVGDGGEQDLGPVLSEHAPQPAGVIMRRDRPDSGQGDRTRPVVVVDPDRRRTTVGVLVAQPKRRHRPVFFLKREKPTRLPLRLPDSEPDHAASARPQSTAASSNTC
jgi:hypothetical protein